MARVATVLAAIALIAAPVGVGAAGRSFVGRKLPAIDYTDIGGHELPPKGGKYDIHTVVVKKGKAAKPKRVTRTDDDAMAPSLAFDGKHVWLAWYEWGKLNGLSRDREVYVAKGNGKSFSKPEQVSPKTVGAYEDHADPVVRPDGKGGAWVAWAWDYHPHQLASRPPVDENSIFVRHVDGRLEMGDPLAAGFRGEGRAGKVEKIKVRGKVPRYPAAAYDAEGDLWVAYTDTGAKKWEVKVEKVR